MKRRQSLKILSLLSLSTLIPSWIFAADKKKKPAPKKGGMPLIDPNEPLAKAMQYKHDASKVGPMRTDKKAFCNNCSKYNVCAAADKACKPLAADALKKADSASCQIFPGKVVKGKGWCLSWQAK